jgi:STE24 endopeptidase
MRPRRLLLFLAIAAVATAAAAQTRAGFDPVAETNRWLASIPAAARAKSDAYFEGGYWLLLWDFLYGAALNLILLFSGLSARIRDFAARVTSRPNLQTPIFAGCYIILIFIASLPLSIYEGFVREHAYDLSNQTMGAWMSDQLKGLAVGVILGSLSITILYIILRKLPRTWWIWGAVAAVVLNILGTLIAPLYIFPLFNHYSRLTDPKVKDPILSLARANGIDVSDVYVYDASKQSKRVSANVSGLLGTEQISLNDNLLHRASPGEIQAVMGHEMGHYVLHHVYKGILFSAVLIVIVFALLRVSSAAALARWGARWRIDAITDLAALPLFLLLLSIFFFILTPVNNSYTRMEESEADLFGINASGQPDGMAEAAVQLAEYRKMSPGPIEEIIFFDHPSGRNRILMAMKWKAEHHIE